MNDFLFRTEPWLWVLSTATGSGARSWRTRNCPASVGLRIPDFFSSPWPTEKFTFTTRPEVLLWVQLLLAMRSFQIRGLQLKSIQRLHFSEKGARGPQLSTILLYIRLHFQQKFTVFVSYHIICVILVVILPKIDDSDAGHMFKTPVVNNTANWEYFLFVEDKTL